MNAVANAANASVQASAQAAAPAAPGSAAARQKSANPGDSGDTVAISEQGKALAKGAGEKKENGESAPSSAKTATESAALSKAALAQTLQTDQTKLKTLQAKLAAAKAQVAEHPNEGSQVGALNAQLNQAAAAVKKVTVQVYS